MAEHLSEYAVEGVSTVAKDEPEDVIRDLVSSSNAPLAIIVDADHKRIASVDEAGNEHELIEAFQDTPIDVFARDPVAIEALRRGAPGVVLLDDDSQPVSTVATDAIMAYVASAAAGVDPLIPGGPTTPNRVYICGRCGYHNNVNQVVRGRTPCQNSNPPYGLHAIP